MNSLAILPKILSMSFESVIDIKRLEVHIPNGPVLFRVPEFRVKQNEKVLIKGRSGCGKTSFLHLLAGLSSHYSGEVQVCGVSLNDLSDAQRAEFRHRKIGLIFQKLNLLGFLTSFENVTLGLNQPKSQAEVLQALQALEIISKKDVQAQKLSQGEQQRVAVARVLVSQPDLVLADEPTSSLDDHNTISVMDKLMRFCSSRSLMVVSHDQRLDRYFDRIVSFEEFAN